MNPAAEISTRERILEAATTVFAEAGYDGARVDAVARRAGVNKATIYYHIGGKQALYAAVLHRVFSPVAEELEQTCAIERPPAEKLQTHIENIARNLDRHPELPRIMLREMAASGGRHLPALATQDLRRIVEITTMIVEEGQRQGIFREVNPFIAHILLIAPLLLLKASAPLRAETDNLPAQFTAIGPDLMDRTATVIGELVGAALRREP